MLRNCNPTIKSKEWRTNAVEMVNRKRKQNILSFHFVRKMNKRWRYGTIFWGTHKWELSISFSFSFTLSHLFCYISLNRRICYENDRENRSLKIFVVIEQHSSKTITMVLRTFLVYFQWKTKKNKHFLLQHSCCSFIYIRLKEPNEWTENCSKETGTHGGNWWIKKNCVVCHIHFKSSELNSKSCVIDEKIGDIYLKMYSLSYFPFFIANISTFLTGTLFT